MFLEINRWHWTRMPDIDQAEHAVLAIAAADQRGGTRSRGVHHPFASRGVHGQELPEHAAAVLRLGIRCQLRVDGQDLRHNP